MMSLKAAVAAALAGAPLATAFVAPTPRVQGDDRSPAAAVASRNVKAAASFSPETQSSMPGLGNGSIFVGSLVAGALAAGLGRGKKKESEISMYTWTRVPGQGRMIKDSDDSRGPRFRTWMNLMRRANKVIGRQRFYSQQKRLAEAGITCAKGGYHKWYPNQETWNLYKGPESHPDNPDFPAASSGYQAVRGWAPAPMASSAHGMGASSAVFVSGKASAQPFGSAKRAVRGAPPASRAGLVLKAHKKAASSSKNHGHQASPRHWGITRKGRQGNAVKVGQLISRAKSSTWYAGSNVRRAKDNALYAVRDGIVQWRGGLEHREVCVLPWEYVEEKATWTIENKLMPKAYEPWMNGNKSPYIVELREKWLESEEGKAWKEKNDKKKAKTSKFMNKVRAMKQKRCDAKWGPRENTPRESKRETVGATSGGESESEA